MWEKGKEESTCMCTWVCVCVCKRDYTRTCAGVWERGSILCKCEWIGERMWWWGCGCWCGCVRKRVCACPSAHLAVLSPNTSQSSCRCELPMDESTPKKIQTHTNAQKCTFSCSSLYGLPSGCSGSSLPEWPEWPEWSSTCGKGDVERSESVQTCTARGWVRARNDCVCCSTRRQGRALVVIVLEAHFVYLFFWYVCITYQLVLYAYIHVQIHSLLLFMSWNTLWGLLYNSGNWGSLQIINRPLWVLHVYSI